MLLLILLSLLAAFCSMAPLPTPLPSGSTSSLVQRNPRTIHEARMNASGSPYRSPSRRRPDARSPLQNIGNNFSAGTQGGSGGCGEPSLEQERSALREAERERYAALQDTPSRRNRRIPGHHGGNQNRPVSPTPGPSRRRPAICANVLAAAAAKFAAGTQHTSGLSSSVQTIYGSTTTPST
ncbi:hypothetical protein C8J57DRAFT_1245904 [Mycena rebaudengoi]|nr:hypothetical protein C8J57DRAFT_1245904 [Mycena rebaudengoi]